MIIQYIPEEKVLKFAVNLIKKSKKTLHLTMIMRKELATTSKDYVDLLKRKTSQGVHISRIGFGTKKDYQKAKAQIGKKLPKNFTFTYYPNLKLTQRMLIADEKEMIFAVYEKKKRLVFYTKEPEIIKGFLNFYEKVLTVSL